MSIREALSVTRAAIAQMNALVPSYAHAIRTGATSPELEHATLDAQLVLADAMDHLHACIADPELVKSIGSEGEVSEVYSQGLIVLAGMMMGRRLAALIDQDASAPFRRIVQETLALCTQVEA